MTTTFGVSSQGELKTLAIISDTISAACRQPPGHTRHFWVSVDAAVDFQIMRRIAKQPLHKATDSSPGIEALHQWVALRNLPECVVLHLIKQESHHYSLGSGDIDLHAHNQHARHMPNPDKPPLQVHLQTHLQHLHMVPHPTKPPS